MTLHFKDMRPDQVTVLPARPPGERLPAILPPTAGKPAATGARKRPQLLFLLLVALPVLAGLLYNFVIASERFAASTSFVVRKNQAEGGVAAMIEGGGFVRSDDDSFAIVEFFQSRDAFEQLNEDGFLRSVFGAEGVDFFSRFPTLLTGGDAREDFYRHFQSFVDVDFDTSTGIVALEVQAFTPEDAVTIAERLLEAGEDLVNRLNTRARNDNYAFAKTMVEDAEASLASLIARLTELRNTEQMIDPQSELQVSNAVMLELTKTQSETEAKLAQLRASSPRSPAIAELELQVRVLKDIIQQRKESLAGDYDSLIYAIESFEQLRLERTLAEKRLLDAIASLYAAEEEAQRGRIYLQRVVELGQPDRYSYPKRYFNIALLLAICFMLYWIVRSTTTLFLEER